MIRLATHPENNTIENFKEKSHRFGTFSVLTNHKDKSAEEVYKTYKTRGDIETMIDAMKNNLMLDKSYMQNEFALQGWMFITFIAIQWYYEIYMLIRKKDLTSKYSPKELLTHLSELKKIKSNENWVVSEFTLKTKKILDKLDIHIT